MHQKTDIKPYLAGVVFAFMVGFSFLGIKVCINYANPLDILAHRYNFAFLAILVFVALRFGKIKLKGKPKKKLIITCGAYVMFMVFQTIGLVYSASIEAAIMFAIIPVLVQIMAVIFLKEKATTLQNIFVITVVGALIYMIIMGAGELHFSPLGTALLMLSSISMSINNVMMRYVRGVYTPFEITAATSIMGFVVFNIAALAVCIYTGEFQSYLAPLMHIEFILAAAYLGICCILFSLLLMAYMQAHMPAVNASIFGNVSTAISIVAGAVILGEELRYYHIICTAIIIAGVIGGNVLKNKEKSS